MGRGWFLGVTLAVACSPGPGRDPFVTDAGPPRDAGFRDAGFRDAGFRDAGTRDAEVLIRDAGPLPSFPFTGVFEIFDSAQQLFVREVEGRLMIIVGGPPYIFVGNIDTAGVFELTAPSLIASGCDRPRITGTYERSSALYQLHYKSCNEQLDVIESDLRGLFSQDYDGLRSGTYEVDMTVTSNPTGCFPGNMTGNGGLWGVSFLADRTVIVYTAHDLVSTPNVYIGRARIGTLAFDAIHNVDASGNSQFAMSGAFEQITVNDPLVMRGQRDVYDTVVGCTFRVQYESTRVAGP